MVKINQQIESEVSEEIREGGFRGDYKVAPMQDKPHVSGKINSALDRIHIGYNPNYEDIRPGKLPIMARHVTAHEQNHRGRRGYNGCPRNADLHAENIVEPIAEVLHEKGFGRADIHYTANTLEDSILHADLSAGFSLDGINEFFSDVGASAEDSRFSSFYDAHVKLNMFLWGSKQQKNQLRGYFVRDKEKQEKISSAVQNFLRKTGISDLEQEINVRGETVSVKDREKIRDFLNDEGNWPKIARIYAEEFSELMEPSYALPLLNHSGRGTKGRENESPMESDGNEFDKEMEGEEFKARRAQKAYQSDSGVPPMMESFETMDLIYQGLARKLRFNVRTFTESEQRPVAWYGRRDFDPDRDDTKHVTFGFDEDGDVVLQKKPHSTKMNIPHKRFPKGFPEIRTCLFDTSDTMRLSPDGRRNIGRTSVIPWGDNSRYHYGLLSWYGMLEYLRQNHLLSQPSISLGNFSTDTIMTRGLQESKRNALSPQFGTTIIDSTKLEEIFKGRGNLVVTISDGAVHNWANINEDYVGRARDHFYAHMQIGKPTQMTRDLENQGFSVVHVNNAVDLAQPTVDLIDGIYRSLI